MKSTLLFCVIYLALGSLATAEVVVKDDTGATLYFSQTPQRIVSLSAGATEMLFVAGAGAKIKATVQGADEPSAAKKIVRIGDPNALQYPRLIALNPEVIVVWKDMTNRLVIESLEKLKFKIYYVSAAKLSDIPNSIQRLGTLAGTEVIAGQAAKAIQLRLSAMKFTKSDIPPLKVFYMILDSPLYTIGGRHILTDALRYCGARNIFADIDFPVPIVEFLKVVKANPDAILMATGPITARDWRERWAAFRSVNAVANKQVVPFIDLRLERMGPTAIEAVAGLCSQLQHFRS